MTVGDSTYGIAATVLAPTYWLRRATEIAYTSS